jgi:DNA-3-methyladenine glycosylase
VITRSFYKRDTVTVARDLLGMKVVRTIRGKKLSGIIVETEAYVADDAACHAYRGKSESNKALFGEPGHAYIYFIYGNHFCLNFVSYDAHEQKAGGVLIRALEPLEGIDLMQKNRVSHNGIQLTNGPGKLTQALAITKNLYGVDVTKKGPLYVTKGITVDARMICAAPRIGISKAQEKNWRFYLCSNSYVSRK